MDLTVLALATWRISSLLVTEDGPYRVFSRLREWLGEHRPDGMLTGLLGCVWCVSVWISFGWVVLLAVIPQAVIWLAMPFALSAGAIIVDCLIDDG
jgi:hypothetical protein